MPKPTLLFVHGTGVRDQSYSKTLEAIRSQASRNGLDLTIDGCYWSLEFGVDFQGKSLPEPLPPNDPNHAAQLRRWEYLMVDPLVDLSLWNTPAPAKALFGATSAAADAWDEKISVYQPTVDLATILDNAGLRAAFDSAWEFVAGSAVAASAFRKGGAEAAPIARSFAEAVVAKMLHDLVAAGQGQALPHRRRSQIVERLLLDWDLADQFVGDLLNRLLGQATKALVRPARSAASNGIAPLIGDIVNYLANGSGIRATIRKKVESLSGPVYVLAHSLGGVASVEMLIEQAAPNVKGLITAGSQAAVLQEFGALSTLKGQSALPEKFPPWINFYDENDLLSYLAGRIFPQARDIPVDSVLPPLAAHSAYWMLDDFWEHVAKFIATNP